MNTNVAIIRPADAPSQDTMPRATSIAPRTGTGPARLTEVLAAVSQAVRCGPGRGVKAWPDGSGGRYLEFLLPDGACPEVDICVHEGRVFVHIKG